MGCGSQDSSVTEIPGGTEANEKRLLSTLTLPGFGMTIPILTDRDELNQYVGRVVAIRGGRGPILNTKQAQIIGVRVSGGQGLQDAYAIGILAKFVTTKEDWEKNPAPGGQGSFGVGTKYVLYNGLDGSLARPQAWGTGYTENLNNINAPEEKNAG